MKKRFWSWRRAEPEPWLAALIRALVYAVTAAVFAWPVAVPEAVVFASCGAGLGALLGVAVARTRIRSTAVVIAAFLALLVVPVLSGVVAGPGTAATFGPAGALRAGQCAAFGAGGLVLSFALRTLTARYRPLAAVEVAVIGLSFAQLVVAHRHGAINRPFAIADPLLAQGQDPTVVFLGVGLAATVMVVLLLLSERGILRTLLHLSLVAILLGGIVGATEHLGLPAPPPTGQGLGLRDNPSDRQREGQGEGGQGGGRRRNEQLEFRDNYNSDQNRVPVGVVLLHDDYSPPSGVYYLRQGAFSQFNGRRLVAATRPDADRDIAPGFPAVANEQIPESPPAMAPRDELDTTVALLADHNRPFALESPVSLTPQTNPDPSRFRRVYRATSQSLAIDPLALIGSEVGAPSWGADLMAHYTEGPADPRYGELAQQIVDEVLPEDLRPDPMSRALAVSAWLGQNGVYSLRSRHADATDPTASFLFGDKTGYCVHFAHAAAYLLRSLGVPSRVATGYAIPESSRQGGSAVLVSGQDSHAWPEVYLRGTGWVIVDVSVQTTLDPPPPPADADLQRLLGELARGLKPLPTDGVRPPPVGRMARGVLTAIAQGALGLILLLLVLGFAIKTWRRLVPVFSSAPALPRVVYRAEVDRLGELNLRREAGESREAFATRVATLAPAFRGLTGLHLRAAFGATPSAEGDIKAAAATVRRELRKHFPLWRRAIGALHPWSWLRTR